SRTKSPPPCAASGSRSRIAVSRTNGSRLATRRGVKARTTSFRRRAGGGGAGGGDLIGGPGRSLGRGARRLGGPRGGGGSARLGGAVGLPVDERAQHVAEAGQRPEVHLPVAVEGRVRAQPAVEGMRIRVELVRERVQVHRGGSYRTASGPGRGEGPLVWGNDH